MAFSHHLHPRGSHDDVVLYTVHTRIFIIYKYDFVPRVRDICVCVLAHDVSEEQMCDPPLLPLDRADRPASSVQTG